MLKKLILLIAVVITALTPAARAFWQNDITMLVVPREVLPLQIAQDISRRYPVLLVSYQMVRGELKLHAWNGDNWISVPVEDYTNGTFFANRPKHAIVVEYERSNVPTALIPNSTWCESANRLTSTEPRAMLHLLGIYFDFPFSDWDQLAKRYDYPLEEINPTLKNVHWWNLRGDELAEKRAKRDFVIDLDKWQYLATLPPPPIKPVIIQNELRPVPEVEIPAAEPVKTGMVNTPVITEEKVPVAKPALAVKPAPPIELKPAIIPTPVPALKPVPEAAVIPSVKPEPVAVPAPVAEPTAAKPIPASEPTPAPLVELPAVQAETTSTNPPAEPVITAEPDPFSAQEIPAAEIVVPQPPKKPWWKIF